MSKKFIFVQFFIVLVLGVLFVLYMKRESVSLQPLVLVGSSTPLKMNSVQKNTDVTFVNPATLLDSEKHYIINFKALKDQLVVLQKKQTQKTYVYFAYLNNSSWIGLNEKDMFIAASTIKVPLAMAVYKAEEQGKIRSADVYSLEDLDLDSNFGDLYKVGTDNSFTVEELVSIMLVYSDNTAMNALFHVLKSVGISDPLADVYSAMGWEYTDFGKAPSYIQINLKTLTNMFLALYNASYLNVTDSSKILAYLSRSDFNDQIVAGVPRDVPVSHKIGVNESKNTYSDCGIVYVPKSPYIVCVGSSGVAKSAADEFIKNVSKVVYQYVINN